MLFANAMAKMENQGVSILDLICKDRNNDAGIHKHERDEKTKEAKMWMARRNSYNVMFKESNSKAIEAKKERDELNKKVQECKTRRDELRKKAAEHKGTNAEEYKSAMEEGDKAHEEMVEYWEKSQIAHQTMMQCNEEAAVAKKLSDIAHKKSVECWNEADKEHQLFIESVKLIEDFKNDPFKVDETKKE